MTPPALAIIAAPPDMLRYSLKALLGRLPQIDEVRGVADSRSLLAIAAERQPRLIVLDANLLNEDGPRLLAQLKAAAPHTRLVVLVDRIEQQQAVPAAAVDRVLLKGYPAADLFASMDELLAQPDRSDDRPQADRAR